jgi:phosphoserine phosphatase
MFFIYLVCPYAHTSTTSLLSNLNANIIAEFCATFNAFVHAEQQHIVQKKIQIHALKYDVQVLCSDYLPEKQMLYVLASTYCIDAFYVHSTQIFTQTQLIAMDMDSTLINIECIDEIADLAGLKTEVSAITHATMQGIITNFTDSLRQRVALLKNIPEALLYTIYTQRLKLSNGAELFLAQAKQKNTYTMLLSGGFTFFSDKLKQRLNFNEAHANVLSLYTLNDALYLNGEVEGTIIDGEQKAYLFKQAMLQQNILPAQTMAIGDGSNDLPMMRAAGISVAYQAKKTVEAYADIAIRICGLDILVLL